MIDIKQYLEQTNTVLLTKDAFEYLKERAIKAEYGPRGDLISREEILTAFAEYVGSGMSMNDFDALWDIVAKIPSVTPQHTDAEIQKMQELEQAEIEKAYELGKAEQPKTGHWIFVDKAKEHAHCSECGYGNVDLFDGRPHNYCPNCGAKMQEVEE